MNWLCHNHDFERRLCKSKGKPIFLEIQQENDSLKITFAVVLWHFLFVQADSSVEPSQKLIPIGYI